MTNQVTIFTVEKVEYAQESHIRSVVEDTAGKNMNKGDLQMSAHLSKGTITKMGKDESVTIDVISRIATALDTKDINNILEIKYERFSLFLHL